MPRRSPRSRSPRTIRLLNRHDSGRGIPIAHLSDHPIEGIGFGRITVVRRGKFAHWGLQSRNADLRIGQLTRIDDFRHNPSVPEFGTFSKLIGARLRQTREHIPRGKPWDRQRISGKPRRKFMSVPGLRRIAAHLPKTVNLIKHLSARSAGLMRRAFRLTTRHPAGCRSSLQYRPGVPKWNAR